MIAAADNTGFNYQQPKRQYRRQGSDSFTDYYNTGLEAEEKVLEFLSGLGNVTVCQTLTTDEQFKDIDAYIDGVSTSIKVLHKGRTYGRNGHMLIELVSQWRQPNQIKQSDAVGLKPILKQHGLGWVDLQDGSWFPGWYLLSEAEQYLIWQGDRLVLLAASDVKNLIATQGFVTVRSLSAAVLNTVKGKNTISGYLEMDDLQPLKEWRLPSGKPGYKRTSF